MKARDMIRMVMVLCLTLSFSGRAGAASDRASTVATAATLTVLSGKVERVGGFKRVPATSGANLAEGDRIVTGPDGRALITFLDGSTVVVEPTSDVSVKQLDVGSRERSRIRFVISAGTVWVRLASWLGGRANVTLESNAYAATAHDGLIGAQARADGTFVCWTRTGTLSPANAGGYVIAVLRGGQKATASPGERPVTDAFAVNQSTIEVIASGAVLPLIAMPDGTRVAGFVDPGIEVNQVFGSLTTIRDGAWMIEVPAGAPGRYLLVLTALEDGPYTVQVIGRYQGSVVYRQESSGRALKAQRLAAEITQDLAPGSRDAPTARVAGGRLGPLRALSDETSVGAVLLSPLEISAARGQ